MRKVVVIVEDNAQNLKLFRDVLRRAGYAVHEAANGREAVGVTRSAHPDLVLMDIQMPVMGGLEATRRLKADPETSGIPVVALTAMAMKDDERKFIEAGCDGYISKPIGVQDFLERVARFISPGGG